MADDDRNNGIHYPSTINEELIKLGQLPDDVDDMGDAAAALFGRSGAPIDLDGAVTGTGVAASSNDATSVTSSTTSKRQSPVWQDFDEVIETVDGIECVIGVCKFYKARLSANSNHGTGHLLRHQKS